MKMQKATYSAESPNPEWKIKGEKWIFYALNSWKDGDVYDVACIPHIPIEIRQGLQIHNIIPKVCDLEKNAIASNFYMGGHNNTFRLNARYKNPHHLFIGSRKNVDLNPEKEKDLILDLLKLAEKIYNPPN